MSSIRDIQEALAAGRSCCEIATQALKRAQADTTNAVVRIHQQLALEQAAVVDARRAAGEQRPLDGVPVLIKDNLCLQGVEVSAASRILAGWHPPYTATAVSRLIDAGAVVIGTANMDEFAFGSSNETSAHGPVANPHDPTRIPGGSSGGSAAGVASGIVPLALGSDTGGSIRQPAALCGCVGLKPSYGRISRYGLIAFGSSLDQIGPLSSSVADTALALQVMAGADANDATCSQRPSNECLASAADLAGLRIGWVPEHDRDCAPAVQQRLHELRQALAENGAELVEISLPHERFAVATYYIIATGEASSNLNRFDGVHYGQRAEGCSNLAELYRQSRSQGFGAEAKRRIMLGTYVLSAGYYDAYYKRAMQVRSLIIEDFQRAFASCDLLLGPTSPSVAFRRGEKSDPLSMYLSDVFTIAANLAGLPALSLPIGSDEQGLPIGAHLQAPQWQDGRLLSAAAAIEKVCQGW
ncbi:MAG: Asp-tRNA(Asn)/Glu-tRNA(Gln) amidotransferase subunit GatA [Planctomycetota bacterium]|nr:MAG: Asp-tRNA(Asn)/Glu-tRNA(Gln) amidotransferase subunit GatA [Planctomycetota bacterium]